MSDSEIAPGKFGQRLRVLFVTCVLLTITGCQANSAPSPSLKPASIAHSATPPWRATVSIDELNGLREKAATADKRLIVVLGAAWCHDSEALANFLQSDAMERYRDRYEVAFVDVGAPQHGRELNSSLVRQLGLYPMRNTPALVILDRDGHQLNPPGDAIAWKNAASRSHAEMIAYFDEWLVVGAK